MYMYLFGIILLSHFLAFILRVWVRVDPGEGEGEEEGNYHQALEKKVELFDLAYLGTFVSSLLSPITYTDIHVHVRKQFSSCTLPSSLVPSPLPSSFSSSLPPSLPPSLPSLYRSTKMPLVILRILSLSVSLRASIATQKWAGSVALSRCHVVLMLLHVSF